jgi:hypothetical protein
VAIVLNLGLRRVARHLAGYVERQALPHLPVRRDKSIIVPPVTMSLIYRNRNLRLVENLVTEAQNLNARLLLWGLDGIAPSLADYTIGSGPGLRGALHTRLIQEGRVASDDYIIMCDDDVEFSVGGLRDFVQIAVEAGFMVSQPAHLRSSHYTFSFTCGRPHLTARATNFVEIGPIVLIHSAFRDRVFPMSDDLGMGWGTETLWYLARRPGERFGIVDAVRIRHCNPMGLDYDTGPERDRLNRILEEAGFQSIHEMCTTTGRWYRWGTAMQ